MKEIPSSVNDHAPILHRSATEICFRVDEVEPCLDPCTLTPAQARVRQHVGRPFLACSHDESSELISATGAAAHGFVDAVYVAFSQHRPLVLTPDAVWMTLAQGFAHHIMNHAEALRSSLVRHKGKMILYAETIDPHASQHWPGVVQQWSDGIRQHVQDDLYQLMLCDFSTTSPVIRTASQVVMMEAFQQYFDYELNFICGIPSITLTGSVADWVRIRERVDVMATFQLDWWTDRLKPICDGFVATAQGNPSQRFWKHIYSPKEIYGGDLITGWLADLFPYLIQSVTKAPTVRNPILDIPRTQLTVQDGLKAGMIPTGLSRAPFTFKSASIDQSIELEILAGFLGVRQHVDTCRLEPEIGWVVAEPELFTQLLNTFARTGTRDAISKPLVIAPEDYRLSNMLRVGIPKELVQMLDRFAAGQVFYEQTPHPWTLRPATEITGRAIGAADSSETVHFMDLADGRAVAYTTVRGKDRARRAGRVLVGRLEGAAIQADSVRVIAKGVTEFLDRVVREEGRYYFDAPSFESEPLH